MWSEFCEEFSPMAEEKRQEEINSIDTLIYLQQDIIKNAKEIRGFTDYDFDTLNRALMVLERLKNSI